MPLMMEMSSGTEIYVQEVALFNRARLSSALSARANALAELQGNGLGVFGTPGFVAVAAVAMAFAESSAAKKAGAGIRRADALFDSVRQNDRKFFDVSQILNIVHPIPSLWMAGQISIKKAELPTSVPFQRLVFEEVEAEYVHNGDPHVIVLTQTRVETCLMISQITRTVMVS